MKKIASCLILMSFSFFGFACSHKNTESDSNQQTTTDTSIKSNELAIKDKEHVKISYNNQAKFLIENRGDERIGLYSSEIDYFQLVNNEWNRIDFESSLESEIVYIEPSNSTEYLIPEQLEKGVDYKMIVPYSVTPYDNGKIEQEYHFTID